MLPWKTLRTICLVLLMLPLIHLVYLVSRDTLAALNNSPEAWESELVAYSQADSSGPLPDDPVVVVGGMRVKLWEGLEDLLAPQPVLMRPLGDAIVDDIVYNYARLVAFYRPGRVVFLPGNSEFHVRDNKSAEDLVDGIKELVALDGREAGTARIYIFTPLKTPLYRGDDERIERSIELLQRWAPSDPRVKLLDGNALLTDPEGLPRPQYFRSDGIHLNEHGYLRLSMLLLESIEKDRARVEATGSAY